MSGCSSVKGACTCSREKAPRRALCSLSLAVLHDEHLSPAPPKWSHLENRWKKCHCSHRTQNANPPPSHRLAMASVTLSIPQQSRASEIELESHGQELVTR